MQVIIRNDKTNFALRVTEDMQEFEIEFVSSIILDLIFWMFVNLFQSVFNVSRDTLESHMQRT